MCHTQIKQYRKIELSLFRGLDHIFGHAFVAGLWRLYADYLDPFTSQLLLPTLVVFEVRMTVVAFIRVEMNQYDFALEILQLGLNVTKARAAPIQLRR